MSTPAVELVGLTKSFGSVTAVDDLDLRIEDGEFFSMLGAERIRQDHRAADDRRLRAAECREGDARRRRRHRTSAVRP